MGSCGRMEEHGGGGRACLLYSCYFFNNKRGGETASVSTRGRGGVVGHLDSVGGGAHWNGVERRPGDARLESGNGRARRGIEHAGLNRNFGSVYSVLKKFGFQEQEADRFMRKCKTEHFSFGFLLWFLGLNRENRAYLHLAVCSQLAAEARSSSAARRLPVDQHGRPCLLASATRHRRRDAEQPRSHASASTPRAVVPRSCRRHSSQQSRRAARSHASPRCWLSQPLARFAVAPPPLAI
jgi:hypothetical protein